MKKHKLSSTAVFAAVAACLMSFTVVDRVVRKQNDGTVVVNTTTLAADVKGYNGPVPLEIHIKKDRIVKIVTLTNSETKKYIDVVSKKLLPQWQGMKVSEALTADVDAVTGATMSSNAIKENVKRGLKYYKKKK